MAAMTAQYRRPSPGERILDVGCGYGDLSMHLPGVDYVGIDSNKDYIDFAKRQHSPNGEFLLGDITDLPTDTLGDSMPRSPLVSSIIFRISVTSLMQTLSRMLLPSGRHCS